VGESEQELWAGWFDAVSDDRVADSLKQCHRRWGEQIEAKKPRCDLSGRCCHFDAYGHRLYATGLEIAWVVQGLDEAGRSRLDEASLPQMDGCPFQVDNLCTVHTLRPLGCRVYFCDPSSEVWQADFTEQFLGEVKAIHGQFDVSYRYIEWREGLAEARRMTQVE
jgi:Fe-S-cluster containining protein